MSKFFAKASEMSESESSSGSEDEVSTQPQKEVAKKTVAAPKKSYYKGYEESSESEEENRVVKSQKDKRLEQVDNIIKDTKNHVKINDFSSLQTDFDKLTEEIVRSAHLVFEEGKDGILPTYIVRTLVHIEDAINTVTSEQKKKFNKTNSVSYNKLKQKMRKYLPITGPEGESYEQQMAKFREKPVWSEDERKVEKKTDKKKNKAEEVEKSEESKEEESEEEESEEEESEEEESEESEEEEVVDLLKIPKEQQTPAQRRLKWVKKERLPPHIQAQLGYKPTAPKPVHTKVEKKLEKVPEAIPTASAIAEIEKETKLNLKNDFQVDYTESANVYVKIKEIQEERSRGKFNPNYHAKLLSFMLEQAKNTRNMIEITLNLVNALLDTNKMQLTGFITRETWLTANLQIRQLISLLDTPQMKETLKNLMQKDQNKEAGEHETLSQDIALSVDFEKSILPALANFIERLDSELLKAFQSINYQKLEYLQRIKDENQLLQLIDVVSLFISDFEDGDKLARLAVIKMNHLYYKNDSLYKKIKERITQNSMSEDQKAELYVVEDSTQVLKEQASIVNRTGNLRMRVKAALYQVYHHGLHNRFNEAKDLLMKTHINEIIIHQDITNQILYNRSIAQIGMAAFRLGQIEDCHDILVDVVQVPKLRETFAQSLSRGIDRAEMDKDELKRQVPHHMHINMPLLDCIYMISAMLLEIPSIAENQFIVNRKVISKNFKKMIDQYDSKVFQLAAESYRDNIVFSAKHLNKSNWQKAIDYIFSIKLISHMSEFQQGNLKEVLTYKFKEAALKAFLCRSEKNYQSFSLESLSKIFELSEPQLIKIVSKMILRNKLHAFVDPAKKLLVLDTQSNEAKELQQLTLQYVDKMKAMVENNERLVDIMSGGQAYGYKERSNTEIMQINASKRNKTLVKGGTSMVPSIGTTSNQMLREGPVGVQVASNKA